MRVIDLALKDLSQIFRDKRSLLFLIGMPIAFTFFMGFAYKGATTTPDPRLAVGWINNDPNGLISQQLFSMLSNSDSVRLVEVKSEQVDEQVRTGKLAAVVIVPEGFSQVVITNNLSQLTMVVDELSNTGQTVMQMVRVPVTHLMSAVEIARLNIETLETQKVITDPSDLQSEFVTTLTQSVQAWQDTTQAGPRVTIEKATGKTSNQSFLGGNPYNQSSPGILLQFVLFGLVFSAGILMQERKTRTLQRLVTTATKPWQIICGHMLATLTVVLFQQIILILFGQFVLHVDYARQPLGILLVAISLGLWISCMGLFISLFSKGEDQVSLYSLMGMFVFSALGGAWFSFEGAGRAFVFIGRLTPGAWAMEGFQNIIIRGLGLSSVLIPTAVLLAYAAIFFGLAVWRFRGELEK